MTIRHPPRREPRVLAVTTAPRGLAFVCADPWVIRSAGRAPCRPRSRTAAILRLVRREKPTAVATPSASLAPAVRRAAERAGIPVAHAAGPRLEPSVAADLYPDLRVIAPGPSLTRLGAFAISVLLEDKIPSRKYAPRRRNPAER